MKAKSKKGSKAISCIQMNISYYGKEHVKIKHYPVDSDTTDIAVKNEDGYWYAIDLNGKIPVNVHIFFSQGMWQAYCESCEKDDDGKWNHWYDPNIVCNNIKVRYRHE